MSNNFTPQLFLTPSDAAFNDQFGSGVAFNADASVMAIGAPGWEGSVTNQGAVYVYDRIVTDWVLRGSVVIAADAASSDGFGYSLALDGPGNTLVVGVPAWEDTITNQGGVYTYDWNGVTWLRRGDVLVPADPDSADNFGTAVALSDDGLVMAVGAPNWDGSLTNQGGVYIFDAAGDGWAQRGEPVRAIDAAAGDLFGRAVSLSANGAVLVVGAPNWTDGALTGQGGVYIFDWSGAWVRRGQIMKPADGSYGAQFGASVAISNAGTVLAVGAVSRALDGVVYIFDWDGAGWAQRGPVIKPARSPLDFYNGQIFGSSVALNGDGKWLAIGASGYDSEVAGQPGAVTLYTAFDLTIYGDVTDAAGAPLVCIVEAYRRDNGALMARVTSGGDGAFVMTTPSYSPHFIVAHGPDGVPRNAQILDRLNSPLHIVFPSGDYSPPSGSAINFSW